MRQIVLFSENHVIDDKQGLAFVAFCPITWPLCFECWKVQNPTLLHYWLGWVLRLFVPLVKHYFIVSHWQWYSICTQLWSLYKWRGQALYTNQLHRIFVAIIFLNHKMSLFLILQGFDTFPGTIRAKPRSFIHPTLTHFIPDKRASEILSHTGDRVLFVQYVQKIHSFRSFVSSVG